MVSMIFTYGTGLATFPATDPATGPATSPVTGPAAVTERKLFGVFLQQT